ncbi:MAG: hypothetical protein GKC04_09335 [Methanomicrobiales archaeon]|nr:hypothetical protein [Methanomicrobiales archaeon]
MDFGTRLRLSLLLLACFAATMMGLQMAAEHSMQADAEAAPADGIATINQTHFEYGPQAWRPFYSPLPVHSGNGNDAGWYAVFVACNGTPYGGNPLVRYPGAVEVTYRFVDLAGTAAFHVIAIDAEGNAKTNRQEGYGNNGFVVHGNAPSGVWSHATAPLPDTNDLILRLVPAGEAFVHFDRPLGGLDAIHITVDPALPKGQVTETEEQSGTFYITHTGGAVIRQVILCVWIDRMQPDAFSLRLESRPLRGEA